MPAAAPIQPYSPTLRVGRLNTVDACRIELARVYKDARHGRIDAQTAARLAYVLQTPAGGRRAAVIGTTILRRLGRLERGRHGLRIGGPRDRLRRRLERLEGELDQLVAELGRSLEDDPEGDPDAGAEAAMELIRACAQGGIAAEADRIRRALLNPAERTEADKAGRARRREIDAMTPDQLDALIMGALAEVPPRARQL